MIGRNPRVSSLLRAGVALATGFVWSSQTAFAQEMDFKGLVETEYRYFNETPSDPLQMGEGFSIAFEATFEVLWDRGDHNIVFTPFARSDPNDKERNHWDIRELRYEGVFDKFELRVGLDKVYWGVTEFVHFVDVINQTDLVENIDREEKLGQPMVNVAVPTQFGTLDFFVLPRFRERTFPSIEGRPRVDLPIDTSRAFYENKDRDEHVDYAARWSHFIGDFDLGLSYFKGTGRDPIFTLDPFAPGGPVLVPTYVQTEQFSIDAQATFDAWLFKAEALTRQETLDEYILASGGFEYSFYGVRGTAADLGLIAEYVYDDRGNAAPQPFNNDVFFGLRLALNDEPSTAILAGLGRDLDTGALSVRIEAERRLGSDFFITAELQITTNVPDTDPLASFEDDDFLQVRLTRYF
jgi:hypothetical protein